MATNKPQRKPPTKGAQAEIFNELVAKGGIRNTPETLEACRILALKAGQYHTLMEDFCNGGTNAQRLRFNLKQITYDQIDQELNERQKRLEQEIHSATLALTRNLIDRGPKLEHHVTPAFSGDPRGFTTKLILPNGYSNCWSGGYGVAHNRQG